MEEQKCVHKKNAQDSSIVFLDGFETMVTPSYLYGVCRICGKSFKYKNIKRKEGVQYADGGRNENET